MHARAGGGRRGELGGQLLNAQLALPVFWAELDVQDSGGGGAVRGRPLATPFQGGA